MRVGGMTAGRLAGGGGWGLMALASVGVTLYAARYLIGDGVGPMGGNPFAAPWLQVHVAGAMLALLVGAAQFVGPLRRRLPPAHRWTGRVYAVGCLVGGGAGLILSLGSTGGPIAGVGFGLLAVVWIGATALGWRAAMQRDFAAHRRWMIRSWALTLAAVTLRLYLPLTAMNGLPMPGAYIAISFLCWIPNLLVAEAYLRVRQPHSAGLPLG